MQDKPLRTPEERAMVPDNPWGHKGELEMRRRFPSSYHWDEHDLSVMMRPVISPALARFIEAQTFFFIATASADGHCDASFRGSDRDINGRPLPALRVIDEQHLVFPDYAGNGFYNSLGNIFVNPHIGMLFVDFVHRRRARINGLAAITEVRSDLKAIWPQAQAVIAVTVEQAFGNCPARIPQMRMITGNDASA